MMTWLGCSMTVTVSGDWADTVAAAMMAVMMNNENFFIMRLCIDCCYFLMSFLILSALALPSM